jgi:hypothetical protein
MASAAWFARGLAELVVNRNTFRENFTFARGGPGRGDPFDRDGGTPAAPFRKLSACFHRALDRRFAGFPPRPVERTFTPRGQAVRLLGPDGAQHSTFGHDPAGFSGLESEKRPSYF